MPGIPISAPATPPTVTAATTTPAATIRRPFILRSSSVMLVDFSKNRSPFWQSPGICRPGPLRTPAVLSDRSQVGHRVGREDSHVTDTRVLVVDDEANITDLVATALRYEGFSVEVACNGTEALRSAETFRPDLVVLDVMLPDRDGFAVVKRLRADGHHVPVVFLTARDSTEEKVKGLTVGGDDYVTKPFSLEELIARVRAVLRRTGSDVRESARLEFADLELDDDTHEVWRGSARVELTPTEYKLLRYLMLNARRALSKAQILDHVWEYDFDGDANVVETYISYLRKKIDKLGPPLIHTIRGVGYTLRTPPEG